MESSRILEATLRNAKRVRVRVDELIALCEQQDPTNPNYILIAAQLLILIRELSKDVPDYGLEAIGLKRINKNTKEQHDDGTTGCSDGFAE